MMKEANKIWVNLHKDRTNMLFAKENYYSEMSTLEALKRQLDEQTAKRFTFQDSPQTKIAQQQLRADQAQQ